MLAILLSIIFILAIVGIFAFISLSITQSIEEYENNIKELYE